MTAEKPGSIGLANTCVPRAAGMPSYREGGVLCITHVQGQVANTCLVRNVLATHDAALICHMPSL